MVNIVKLGFYSFHMNENIGEKKNGLSKMITMSGKNFKRN
jgi:hypothetical protein